MAYRLLLIEDEDAAFAPVLNDCGVAADVTRCGVGEWQAVARSLSRCRPDLLMPVACGGRPEWLRFFGSLTRTVTTPMLAVLRDHCDADLMSAAVRAADDFLVWSGDRHRELRERVARLLGPAEDRRSIFERLTDNAALGRLVGDSPAFAAAINRIPLIAKGDGVVLILGETGTGKELCARAVHHLSPRRHLPFIPVDCAALPDHLLENELFGHVRGAFTDADRAQVGLVAMAEGGTLFLDEIDSLAMQLQAKLLRLVEERTYKPLGADRFSRANVRILVAANRRLEDLVRQNQFRSDLFFRLNVLRIDLPPLRNRRADIPALARHLLERAVSIAGTDRKTLTAPAIEKLQRADWPGNVRELFNVIQQAVTFAEGSIILARHVVLDGEQEPETSVGGFREAKRRTLEAFEHTYVEQLLRKHDGNITRSAAEAGKDRRAFSRLVKKYRIDPRALARR